MKPTSKAASPRTEGVTAKTSQTYGGRAPRRQRHALSETPRDGAAVARAVTSFKEDTRSPSKRSASQPTHMRALPDPYSFSDHEDEGNRTRDQRAARKRPHPTAFPAPDFSSKTRDAGVRIARSPGLEPVQRPNPQKQLASTLRRAHPQKSRPNIPILEPVAPERGSGKRRARLIDALAAQKTVDSDAGSGSDENARSGQANDSLHQSVVATTSTTPCVLPPESNLVMPRFSPRKQATSATTSTKVKLTYSQSRSIASKSLTLDRNDQSDKRESEVDDFLASPLAFPAPDLFDAIDGSDEESKRSSKKLKGIHELRRAGANMRFTDELGDLLTRIGSPTSRPNSMRRNALLELAEKLRRPSFADQFRDHADRDGVVENIGDEEDVTSGFALCAALVEFLSRRPAPHLLQKMAAEGAGKLLGRLLAHAEDIGDIATWRKTNLSRHTQLALRGVRSHLTKMDIWMGYTVSCLSPRTIALKLLNMLYGSGENNSLDMVWQGCVDGLSAIANAQAERPVNDGVDLAHAVTIFEEHSNVVREALQESDWLPRNCSTAFFLFRSTLGVWSSARNRVHLAALKMAINVTNTVRGAAEFSDASLLADLSSRISSGIAAARDSLTQQGVDKDSYDALVLVLGVMINIQEHCPTAREMTPKESTERLAAIYQENRSATHEADSEDKSRLSVVLGYLAVLLGYLCLNGPGLSAISDTLGSDCLRELRTSIREFTNVYKSVDNKVQNLESLVSELQARFV